MNPRCRNLRRWLGVACALCLSRFAHAGEVVAHPSVALSADEVKELFLGDKQLAGAMRLIPVDNRACQADFLAKVMHSDAAKYGSRWTKKAFREGMNAPAVKGSDAEVIAFVKATPGAVGYVTAGSAGAKVLLRY